MPGWRQSGHNMKKIKRIYRKAQKMKRSTSKDEKKQAQRAQCIVEAHQVYIEVVQSFLTCAEETIQTLCEKGSISVAENIVIEGYISHARRQIDQINRRVMQGEVIPQDEKVYSIFEEHTEWICKGKAGVPQELGLKVCILEDQYRFILHHVVMENQEDVDVAIPIIKGGKERFPGLYSCSFDKGFHSSKNRKRLDKILEYVILPKKGKLSFLDKLMEHADAFILGRRRHSAVDSAINALENHGLDRCLDHGIHGFKRYVALSIVARNIQVLGHYLQQRELKRQKRRDKLKQAREKNRHRLCA